MMKKIETLFSKTSNFDTPKKINRFEKKVPQSIVQEIESGITIEQLNEIQSKYKLPIFKYKTQITIHGLFSNVENNYLYGYKNIFQNKNKSIGIKWGAIDEYKRSKLIAPALKYIGFSYFKNSSQNSFQYVKAFNKDNYETVLNYVKSLFDKIDTSLFFGNKYLNIYSIWGQRYFVIDLVINGIFESNITKFLNSLGLTSEFIESEKNREIKEREFHEAEYNKERELRVKNEHEAWSKAQCSIDKLKSNYTYVNGSAKEGTYIKPTYNSYTKKVEFELSYIHYPQRAKIARINRIIFQSLNEAINCDIKASWSDKKVANYKGYKIK